MNLSYRDSVHGYWLDGKRCTGISGLGKLLDNTKGLDDWAKRHVAYGIATRPDLQNLIVSHWDETNPDAKKMVNGFCEQAIGAAKAGAAANTGTAVHRTLERQDAGETGSDDEHRAEVGLQKLTDAAIADLDVMLKGKDAEIVGV